MKYKLKWSGRQDSEVVQLAFAYCKSEIPICKDVCEFIDYNRYMELIAASEIAEPTSCWAIEEGQVGMICYTSYAKDYASSWENLGHCYKDFMAGYAACEKKLRYQLDWDSAIAHEKVRNAYLKKCKRSFTFNVSEWDRYCNPIYDPQASKVRTCLMRNGSWKFTVTDTCTGPEFEHLVWNVCMDCKILMPAMEPDPRKEETVRYDRPAPKYKIHKK